LTLPGSIEPSELFRVHGPDLVRAAHTLLARDGSARVAGVILTPGCTAPPSLRAALLEVPGNGPPGRTIGIVARRHVEPLLRSGSQSDYWMEQGWQPQTVLPVALFAGASCHLAFLTIRGGPGSDHER